MQIFLILITQIKWTWKEDLLQNKCTETGAYVQKIILN